jgi:hypothetical protein
MNLVSFRFFNFGQLFQFAMVDRVVGSLVRLSNCKLHIFGRDLFSGKPTQASMAGLLRITATAPQKRTFART